MAAAGGLDRVRKKAPSLMNEMKGTPSRGHSLTAQNLSRMVLYSISSYLQRESQSTGQIGQIMTASPNVKGDPSVALLLGKCKVATMAWFTTRRLLRFRSEFS